MIHAGEQYREGTKDGRDIWRYGERVKDVMTHPAFKPIFDVKSRMYNIVYEPDHSGAITYRNCDPVNPIFTSTALDAKPCADSQGATCSFDCRLADYKDSVHRILIGKVVISSQ